MADASELIRQRKTQLAQRTVESGDASQLIAARKAQLARQEQGVQQQQASVEALGAVGDTPRARVLFKTLEPFKEGQFGLSPETVQSSQFDVSEVPEVLQGFPRVANAVNRLVLETGVSPVVALVDLVGAAVKGTIGGVSQALLEKGVFKGGDIEEKTEARKFERDLNEIIEVGGLFAARPKGGLRTAVGKTSEVGRLGKVVKKQEASEIIKAGEAANIPVGTSDILPPQTFAGRAAQSIPEKIPVIGTGGKQAAKQTARQGAITNLATEFGINLDTPLDAEIIKSLNDVKNVNKLKAVDLRRSAVDRLNQHGEVGVPQALKSIDDEIARLSSLRDVADTRTISKLKDIKNSITDGNFEHVGNVRTAIISDIKGLQRGDFTALPSQSEAVLQKVKSAIDSDMKQFATDTDRTAGADWIKSNRLFADEFTKFRNSELKKLISKGDVTPEVVNSTIFAGKRSELNRLYNNLDDSGRKNVRASVIQRVLQKSGYPDNPNPDAFARELGRENTRRAVKIFFRGADNRALMGFHKLLNATRRAQAAAVSPPTGQQLIPLVAGGAVVTEPIATLSAAATISAAARVYESAPVRNALIKLSTLNSGTKAFDTQLIRTVGLMNAIDDE